MQLLVLVPAVLLIGVPSGAPLGAAAFTSAQAETPAARLPDENSRWMLELPTRAPAASPSRTATFAAVLPTPLGLPPAAEGRMMALRSVAPDSTKAVPGPSRAPPVV